MRPLLPAASAELLNGINACIHPIAPCQHDPYPGQFQLGDALIVQKRT